VVLCIHERKPVAAWAYTATPVRPTSGYAEERKENPEYRFFEEETDEIKRREEM
jgi:acyl-homoserine lactone acylase PvdQ